MKEYTQVFSGYLRFAVLLLLFATGYSTNLQAQAAGGATITSFSPTTGHYGTLVTLTGTNFTGVTSVLFGPTAATSFTVVSATTITVTVPTGATTSQIRVLKSTGPPGASPTVFTILQEITSFSPVQGPVGTAVTIHGYSFSGITAVKIGSVNCSYNIVNDSVITLTIPTSAVTAAFAITFSSGGPNGNTITSTPSFIVTIPAPVITSFTPTSAQSGEQVIISGHNFTGATQVKVNNQNFNTYVVVNDSTIIAVISTNDQTGYITVTTDGGTAISSAQLVILPTLYISSFSPASGPVGTVVTIKGSGFLNSGTRTVRFNGVSAAYTTLNDSVMTATVPTNATTGSINITIGRYNASSLSSFVVTNTSLAINSFSPATGPTGTTVTIKGSGFTNITAVAIGSVLITQYTRLNDSTLTVVIPSGATSGLFSVAVFGGTIAQSTTSFIVSDGIPTITSFTPASGPVGTTVTVTGTNFVNLTGGKLNGVNISSYNLLSSTSLTFVVPAGATTGKITVTNNYGTGTSATNFTVSPATFTSFSPASGLAGSTVTIKGTYLSTVTQVGFNGTTATFTLVNDSTLTATVPAGATTGLITLSTPGGTLTSASTFTVLFAPAITGFSPTQGVAGTTVTITGTNLTGATSVSFNGTPAASYTVVNATTLTAVVPATATTGPISLTTSGGTATSSSSFTVLVPPVITAFSPAFGAIGAAVTLTGTNFTGATGVTIGSVSATFTVVSATSITPTVPTGATTGTLTVTTPGGTAVSTANFTVIPAPAITSFTPVSGPTGTTVVLTGTNFTGATSVQLNGTAAAYTVVSSTSISLSIPSGAATGQFTVTTAGGTAVSSGTFTVIPTPAIASFSPASGIVGTTVTITGTNFSGSAAVAFNGVSAVYTLVSSTVISAVVPGGAVTGPITVATGGGTATSSSNFTVIQPPTVTAFSPAYGFIGTTVTITGTNFSNASSVQFNGTAASTFTVKNADTLTAVVPSGATSGLIKVVTPGGTGVSVNSFTIYGAPAITSFTPVSGPVGTVITVTGTVYVGVTSVTLNGTAVPYVVTSSTSITVTVPTGAASGKIAVTTGGGTATSASSFTVVPAPAITSFTPASGPTGTVVTITGTNFSAATSVTFNGTNAPSYAVANSTTITVSVPAGATTGTITVTTPGGTAVSSGSFTVIPAPTLTAINPVTGFAGTVVTLTGTNLTGATAVTFNGTSASYTVVSATSITATVPAGASTGVVAVVTPGGTASGPVFTVIGAPTISSFTPATGYAGTTVTLTGTNYISVSAVTFNGISATYTVVNSTSITAVVPAGATTGKIAVTTPGGTARSVNNFIVIPAPTLTSFSPASGFEGYSVTLTGTNLSGTTSVLLGSLSATFSVQSNTSVTFTVPAGAATGYISLSTPGGTAVSATQFVVTGAPTITVFTPVTGSEAASVLVKGHNFVSVSAVQLAGTNAAFTIINDSTLVMTVPAGANSGSISITTPGGTATSLLSFTVTPASTPSYCTALHTDATPCRSSRISGFAITGTSLSNTPINCPASSANSFTIFPPTGTDTDTLKRSLSYTLKVTMAGTQTAVIGVWIDYNRDGQYAASEYVANSSATASGSTFSQSITVPATASIGLTGIRIRSRAFSDGAISGTDACTSFNTGETQDYYVSLYYAPAPTVTSFNPTSGLPNATVTITGTNFTGTTEVDFNGMAASFTVVNSTTITALVPTGAGTGPISVTTAGGTGVSASNFTYIVPLTVTAAAVTGSYCAGDTLTLYYTSTGIFNGGNKFNAQISDATGSFNFATALGSSTAANGSIHVTLPRSLSEGSSYEVRVISSSPVVADPGNFSNITIHALPVVSAGAYETQCSNAAAYTLTGFSPAGGTWSGNGVNAAGLFNPANALAGANRLTYTVTNEYGCIDTATKVITINTAPAQPAVTLSGSSTFCQGDSVILSGPAGAATYIWSNGASTQSITVRLAGTYSLNVTNAAGCTSAASTATTVTILTVPAQPAVTITGNTTFCAGDSAVLSAPAGFAGYLWSNGAASRSVTVKTSDTLSVQVQFANGCFSPASTPVGIKRNPLPAAPAVTIDGNTTFCAGDSVTLNAPGGFAAYAWSNGAVSQGIRVKASGSYSVTVKDANGCLSPASAPVTVTVNANPATPAITASGVTTFCEGDSVTLSGPAGAATYTWSNGANTASITVKQSGVFSLYVTNANGCVSPASAQTQVVVNTTPGTPSISASGATTFCQNDSVVLTASAGYSEYLWSNGATTRSITAAATGTYSVQSKSPQGCYSKASSPVAVTVNALPAQPAITATGNTTFCTGDSTVLTADAATAYLWSNGATTRSITVKTSGTYSVSVFNANGCQSPVSAATSVTANPVPAKPSITLSGASTFCSGDSVVLSAPASAAYLWSNGSTAQSVTVKTSQSLSVVVSNSFGCASPASDAVTVTVNQTPAAPSITASGATTFCSGDSVTLTATSGFAGYLWSNGSTAPAVTVKATGSYSVQVISAAGCTSSASAATAVTVNPTPGLPVITASGATTFCAPDSVTLAAPAGFASYIWSNGKSTQAITVNASGNYSVQTVNASGCTSSVSAATAVTVNALPTTPAIRVTGATTFCAGDSVTLTATSGYIAYIWSNGAISPAITVKATGDYTVQVVNVSGCTSSVSAAIAVTVYALPTLPVITASGATTFCAGDSVTLSAPAGAAAYLWNNGASTASITVRTAGSYSVRTTNASGCTSLVSAVTAVTVNALPTGLSTRSDSACNAGTRALRVAGGAAGLTYQWYTDAAGQNPIAGATNRNYTTPVVSVTTPFYVKVTNASGCSDALLTAKAIVLPKADTTVTRTGHVLQAVVNAAYSYQWLNNGTAIPGATASNYTVTADGVYSVKITLGTCPDTSSAHPVNITGIAKQAGSLNLNVYPNPSTGIFNLKAEGLSNATGNGKVTAHVTDALGRTVLEQTFEPNTDALNTQLDLSGMPSGLYTLQLVSGSSHATLRLRVQ